MGFFITRTSREDGRRWAYCESTHQLYPSGNMVKFQRGETPDLNWLEPKDWSLYGAMPRGYRTYGDAMRALGDYLRVRAGRITEEDEAIYYRYGVEDYGR